MALAQALRSGGRCARTSAAVFGAASRTRAQPHRTFFGNTPESVIYRRKQKSPKYTLKIEQAEHEWDYRATRIKNGEEKNLWDEFEERGFVKDVAGNREMVRELMRVRRIGVYAGIDPTANSLHLGHLVPLMPLFWMYMHGYRAFTLIGGSTARIGDPTDRLESRKPLAKSDYVANMAKIHFQLKSVWMHVDEQARLRGFEKSWAQRKGIVNNNAWWNGKPWYEIMKRVGMFMRIGPMLSRDTVKNKMKDGDGVSFAEFSYPIMQGWDWFELANQLDVQMQIGGSDQFGNILTGIQVFKVARDSDRDPATRLPRDSELDDPVGFTVPLLTDSSGAKFGKSAGNAVWLDAYETSIYDFYGYLVRRPDDDVERLLKLLTFMPLAEIQTLMAEHAQDPSKRVAQHKLAHEVTSLVHGTKNATEAANQHRAMYQKPLPEGEDQYAAEEGKPTTVTNRPRMDMILPRSLILGTSIGRILQAAGLAESASDGHRLASKGGAYIGGAPGQFKAMNTSALSFTPVKVWAAQDTEKYLIDDEYLILRKGKHNLRIIKVVSDEEYAESGQSYRGMPFTGAVRKMNARLKELKSDSNKADEIEGDLAAEMAAQREADLKKILVFPKDKGRQHLSVEGKLRDELKKSQEREEREEEEWEEAAENPESDEKTK